MLEHLGLLDGDEAAAWKAHAGVLSGFEAEPVNKSYKLVTLRALVHDQTLGSGSSITQLAWTSHRLVRGDPRLVADTRSDTGMGDPVAAGEGDWRDYWRRWPLAAWAGELRGAPGRWFRIDGERFVPTFAVDERMGATFDAMVAELVDWRLARYLFTKRGEGAGSRVRVGQANGRPLVWLDREHNPGLPTGETRFTADGEEYVGNFVKIALNVARRLGSRANDLRALLRRWFGEEAASPGPTTTSSCDALRPGGSSGRGVPRISSGRSPATGRDQGRRRPRGGSKFFFRPTCRTARPPAPAGLPREHGGPPHRHRSG